MRLARCPRRGVIYKPRESQAAARNRVECMAYRLSGPKERAGFIEAPLTGLAHNPASTM